MRRFLYNAAALASMAALGGLAIFSAELDDAVSSGLGIIAVVILLAFLRGKSARVAMMAFAGYVMVRYVAWRFASFPVDNGWVALIAAGLLFASELYTMSIVALGYFVSARPMEREPVPLPEDESLLPMVDVYIPTYSEPLSVVAPTVMGALEMQYPKSRFRVCVLDDGAPRALTHKNPQAAAELAARAEDLKALCLRHGAVYLTRADNLHAKSGNLNAAMLQTDGELIAILDADHIPSSDFLKNTVGFFLADAKAALVQTPHFFTNADPVEKNLGLFNHMPAENDLFYRVIQKGLDLWNTAFFCGSGAILRRAAVEDAGGFSTDSITEDASTTVKMHQRGWRTIYYGRPMLAGLQPETFSGFLVQRIRWGTGMLQILIKQNPFMVKGLSIGQRICYWSTAVFWLFPFARMIAFFAPLLSIFFSLRIYPGDTGSFVGYTLPYILATLITAERTTGKFRRIFASELYETLQAMYLLPALISTMLRPSSPTFQVTPKGEKTDRDYISEFHLPFYVCIALTAAGVLWGLRRMALEPEARGFLMLAVGWLLISLFLGLGAIGTIFERAQRRSRPRVDINEPIWIVDDKGETEAFLMDANELGLRLRVKEGHELTTFSIKHNGRLIPTRALARGKFSKAGEYPALYEFTSPEEERAAVSLAFGDSARWQATWERREAPANFVGSFFGMLFLSAKGANAHLKHVQAQGRSRARIWAARATFASGLLVVGLPAEGQVVSAPLDGLAAMAGVAARAQDAIAAPVSGPILPPTSRLIAAAPGLPAQADRATLAPADPELGDAFAFELAPREQLSGVEMQIAREAPSDAFRKANRYVVWANGQLAGQFAMEKGASQILPIFSGAFAPGVNTLQVALAPVEIAPDVALSRHLRSGATLSLSQLTLHFAGFRPNGAATLAQLPLAFDRRSWLPREITILESHATPRETALRDASLGAQALASRMPNARLSVVYEDDATPEAQPTTAGGLRIPVGALRGGDVLLVGRRESLAGFIPKDQLKSASGPSLGMWPALEGRSIVVVATGDTDEQAREALRAFADPRRAFPATSWLNLRQEKGEMPSPDTAPGIMVGLAGDGKNMKAAAIDYAMIVSKHDGKLVDIQFSLSPRADQDQIILGIENKLSVNVRQALPGYSAPEFGAAVGLPFVDRGAHGVALIGHDGMSVRRAVERLRESDSWARFMAAPVRFADNAKSIKPLETQPRSAANKIRGWMSTPFVFWPILALVFLIALFSINGALGLQDQKRQSLH